MFVFSKVKQMTNALRNFFRISPTPIREISITHSFLSCPETPFSAAGAPVGTP